MSGTPHLGRFSSLNSLLQREEQGLPRLVIDLDLLDHNIAQLCSLQPPERLRLVAKSLPSFGLLEYIAATLWGKAGRLRLMVFHLPFLQQLSRRFLEADILMGKPLPIRAMAFYYRNHPLPDNYGGPEIQWLVDTADRLMQVIELAGQMGCRLSVSLELDVGMHRGGISSGQELGEVLKLLRSNTESIQLCGFMGYDAHAAKAPWPRSVNKACDRSSQIYAGLLELARSDYPELEEQPWCINGAGSPTLSLHGASSPLNDFSMGSALLKPAGFDVPSLDTFKAAAWIATPVIKRLRGVDVPFLEKVPSARRDTLFIYGGRWMATPASPESLRENKLYGLSSNQQMFTVDSDCGIAADDYVFLRPNQSEAVLLQFGDLVAVRRGTVVAHWPVMRNELDSHMGQAQS